LLIFIYYFIFNSAIQKTIICVKSYAAIVYNAERADEVINCSYSSHCFLIQARRVYKHLVYAFLQADIKEWQTQLLEQLLGCIQRTPGPPVRRLIGRCLAALFSVGDTFMLFDTVNKCNDLLKNRDDSPTYLPTRLLVLKNNITLLGGDVLKYFYLQSGNLLSGVHV
jgi:hypothetical protein